MYNISNLRDKYPEDYVINMSILGNGYENPIFVSFIPIELDRALSKNSKNICKIAQKYYDKNKLSKDVYNKIMCDYCGGGR